MKKPTHKFAGKPVRIPVALRQELENAIQAHLTAVEKLTAVLDHADGNSDLEPSLGHHPYGTPVALTDCEGADANDEGEYTWTETHGQGGHGSASIEDDMEPSLAHTLDVNQARARKNLNVTDFVATDGEAEHDGREPSLGAPSEPLPAPSIIPSARCDGPMVLPMTEKMMATTWSQMWTTSPTAAPRRRGALIVREMHGSADEPS